MDAGEYYTTYLSVDTYMHACMHTYIMHTCRHTYAYTYRYVLYTYAYTTHVLLDVIY